MWAPSCKNMTAPNGEAADGTDGRGDDPDQGGKSLTNAPLRVKKSRKQANPMRIVMEMDYAPWYNDKETDSNSELEPGEVRVSSVSSSEYAESVNQTKTPDPEGDMDMDTEVEGMENNCEESEADISMPLNLTMNSTSVEWRGWDAQHRMEESESETAMNLCVSSRRQVELEPASSSDVQQAIDFAFRRENTGDGMVCRNSFEADFLRESSHIAGTSSAIFGDEVYPPVAHQQSMPQMYGPVFGCSVMAPVPNERQTKRNVKPKENGRVPARKGKAEPRKYTRKNDGRRKNSPQPSHANRLYNNSYLRRRIFNREAFCNICNKEFCNKYFLKTHKANKHGIYFDPNELAEDSSDSSGPLPAHTTPVTQNGTPIIYRNWTRIGCGRKTKRGCAISTKTKVKDSSAFCDVCEKEFCNKYFLKRHKEKMHGIAMGTKVKRTRAVGGSGKGVKGSKGLGADAIAKGTANLPVHNFDNDIGGAAFIPNIPTGNNPIMALSQQTLSDILQMCLLNGLSVKQMTDYALDMANTGHAIMTTAPSTPGPSTVMYTPVQTLHGLLENAAAVTSASGYAKTEPSEYELRQLFENTETNNPTHYCPQYDKDVGTNGIQEEKGSTSQIEMQPNDDINGSVTYHSVNGDYTSGGSVMFMPSGGNSAQGNEQVPFTETMNNNTCQQCGKEFSTRGVLRLHQKYVHGTTDIPHSPSSADEMAYLEKVHAMILKFSWSNFVVTYCEICEMEYGKSDVLELHLINTHLALVNEVSRIIEDASPLVFANPVSPTHTHCRNCSRIFTNAVFSQHVCASNEFNEEVASTPSPPSQISPGNKRTKAAKAAKAAKPAKPAKAAKAAKPYCNICKKDICNKYFMKMHMSKMHGITVNNTNTGIGAKCDLCDKELCSKHNLRLHKRNCHGAVKTEATPATDHNKVSPVERNLPNTLASPSNFMPYAAQYTEEMQRAIWENALRNCVSCGKKCDSPDELKLHLVKDHGATLWQNYSEPEEFSHVENQRKSPSKLTLMTTASQNALNYMSCSITYQVESPSEAAHYASMNEMTPAPPQNFYKCQYCLFVTADKGEFDGHSIFHEKSQNGAKNAYNDGINAYNDVSRNFYNVTNMTQDATAAGPYYYSRESIAIPTNQIHHSQ